MLVDAPLYDCVPENVAVTVPVIVTGVTVVTPTPSALTVVLQSIYHFPAPFGLVILNRGECMAFVDDRVCLIRF